jgi:hypothetical protein
MDEEKEVPTIKGEDVQKEVSEREPILTPEQADELIVKSKETLKRLPDVSRRHGPMRQFIGNASALRGRIRHDGELACSYKEVPVFRQIQRERNKYIPHIGLRQLNKAEQRGFAGKGFYYKRGPRKIRHYLEEGRYLGVLDQEEIIQDNEEIEVVFVPKEANGYIDHHKCVRGLLIELIKMYPVKQLVVDTRVT